MLCIVMCGSVVSCFKLMDNCWLGMSWRVKETEFQCFINVGFWGSSENSLVKPNCYRSIKVFVQIFFIKITKICNVKMLMKEIFLQCKSKVVFPSPWLNGKWMYLRIWCLSLFWLAVLVCCQWISHQEHISGLFQKDSTALVRKAMSLIVIK